VPAIDHRESGRDDPASARIFCRQRTGTCLTRH
jgi:hypothetical protein